MKLFVINSKNLDSGVELMQLTFGQHMILNNDNPKEEITKNIRDLLKIKLNWKEQKVKLYTYFCKKVITRYWKLLVSVSTFSIPVKRWEKKNCRKKIWISFFLLLIFSFNRSLVFIVTEYTWIHTCARANTHSDT